MEQVPAMVRDLRNYYEGEKSSFHMPGHKQRIGHLHPLTEEIFGEKCILADVSEMGGYDYLHAPEGPLREAQANAAKVFGAEETFFLVNGSTGGNIAVVFACSGEGDSVMFLRGSHRSVYTGTVLSGATPVYLPMSYHEREDGWFVADPTRLPAYSGRLAIIHITRPNYYGLACDLAPYRELAERTGALLVVDEAHGPHYGLAPGLPRSALQEGADVVIQSTHKTLGSLGQSTMLHLGSSARARAARPAIARALQMLQSSSPSSLFTLSLDLQAAHLGSPDGQKVLAATVKLARKTRTRISAINGFRVLEEAAMLDSVIKFVDVTKIVIDVTGTGLSGFAARATLQSKYKIWIELAAVGRDFLRGFPSVSLASPLALTGLDFRRIVASICVGDTEESCDLLVAALTDLAASPPAEKFTGKAPLLPGPPPAGVPPRVAMMREAEAVPVASLLGRICAEYVIPYPPGIPLVAPGEIFTEEGLAALAAFKKAGSRIVGPADGSIATIRVLKQ